MTITTSLLVIGAGPYALSAAALAREHGIDTMVVGRPMGFWRRHMPAGMLLRSGPDWHLDAAGSTPWRRTSRSGPSTRPTSIPCPSVCSWTTQNGSGRPRGSRSSRIGWSTWPSPATGSRPCSTAGRASPPTPWSPRRGSATSPTCPAWAGSVPAERAAHTCDLVRFGDLSGARVLIVGGRQSAYEWAALLVEHGAARIDLVHRHDVPRFERVSWSFVDPYLESTMRVRGWWRSLSEAEQDAITKRFWEVGRLTLEYWLTPRLASQAIHRWPGTEVVRAEPTGADGELRVRLSSGDDLSVDQVVFASGYRADLARVPYLAGVLDRVKVTDGFPVLDEAFGASLSRLYLPGFVATRDFGPFFGFVKGTSAAARLIVGDLLARP